MELSILSQLTSFWCHFCQVRFNSELKPGKDYILCPQCNNDFCEITTKNNHPQLFKPFQKQPHKKQNFLKRIDKQYLNISVNQLAQIIQIRESENFQVTQEMLQNKRKIIQTKSQCSICSIYLQSGQLAIVPSCNHTFHQQCLTDWIKRKNNCPTCRQTIIDDAQQNSYL